MSSGCEFEQEGFCLIEDYAVSGFRCQFAKGLEKTCSVKPEDLVEYCEDCDMPVTICKCNEEKGSGRERGFQVEDKSSSGGRKALAREQNLSSPCPSKGLTILPSSTASHPRAPSDDRTSRCPTYHCVFRVDSPLYSNCDSCPIKKGSEEKPSSSTEEKEATQK